MSCLDLIFTGNKKKKKKDLLPESTKKKIMARN